MGALKDYEVRGRKDKISLHASKTELQGIEVYFCFFANLSDHGG